MERCAPLQTHPWGGCNRSLAPYLHPCSARAAATVAARSSPIETHPFSDIPGSTCAWRGPPWITTSVQLPTGTSSDNLAAWSSSVLNMSSGAAGVALFTVSVLRTRTRSAPSGMRWVITSWRSTP
ncbi:hypothetical protein G6F53_013735 [Rhizopus delemar]|nr:hypothetical protein G6F53_013735 [Rhizopus delemar]